MTWSLKHGPLCDHKSDVQKDGVFSGYASVFHQVDTYNDVMLPGAFTHTLNRWREKKTYPLLLWQHCMKEPLGYWMDMKEDDTGLWVQGRLLLDVQRAKDALSFIQHRVLQGLSIGYIPILTKKNQGKRYIHQVELGEISVVLNPANAQALIHTF